MDERLNRQLETKTRALEGLTHAINEARDKFERQEKQYTQLLAQKRAEIVLELEKHEERLIDPKRGIKATREDLAERESEVRAWEEHLKRFSGDLDNWQDDLNTREMQVTEALEYLTEAWGDFMESYRTNIQHELSNLKGRADSLSKREEIASRRTNMLNDQLRSFKAAQQEMLGK